MSAQFSTTSAFTENVRTPSVCSDANVTMDIRSMDQEETVRISTNARAHNLVYMGIVQILKAATNVFVPQITN